MKKFVITFLAAALFMMILSRTMPEFIVHAEDKGITLEELGKNVDLKLPPNLPTFEKGFKGIKDPVKATESFFLNYIISPIFLLAAGVAVIMILYASFRIITARGEEEGITKAKTTLIWAAAGLALIMLAYTLVRNISTILTGLQSAPP